MSHPSENRPSVTVPDLGRMAKAGERIVMTTAYDAPMARIADASGVDVILVGDSLGNVVLGFENTLPVTMAMMNHHVEAVARTRPRALLLADMPFLSFHLGLEDTLRNAGGLVQRGAQGVKLEGGRSRVPVVKGLVEAGIPVMGHLGLTPQSLNVMGGYRVQGREAGAAVELLEDALRLQEAGCFSIVQEGMPAELAGRITQELEIPTIGIGAGAGCSGQVLVIHDILGLLEGPKPKFVKAYMNGFEQLRNAMSAWGEDVRRGRFPGDQESYMLLPDAVRDQIRAWNRPKE
jgi:3-methyl-2-oxobutanoate hydroxymethyltransferase